MSPKMPGMSRSASPWPAPIAANLSANSEKHAVLTLHKVRDILGMSRKGPGLSADMRSELSKNLTWRELIHTTYFDIPEFVDLTAYGLNQAGLSTLKSNYWSDPSRNAAAGWRNEIAATA